MQAGTHMQGTHTRALANRHTHTHSYTHTHTHTHTHTVNSNIRALDISLWLRILCEIVQQKAAESIWPASFISYVG